MIINPSSQSPLVHFVLESGDNMLDKLWSKACNTCASIFNINGSEREVNIVDGLELHSGDDLQIPEDILLSSIITHLDLDYNYMSRVEVIHAIHNTSVFK